MYTYHVGVSRNGRQVYTDIINSVAGRCLSRQPHLARLAKSLIEFHELSGAKIYITQNMGRVIGTTNIVATTDADQIFYAQLPKQAYVSRFVKNRSMEPSEELSVVFVADKEGNYELINVWIGPACPAFPGASDASADSKAYWLTHALIAGSESVQSHTITKVCPY